MFEPNWKAIVEDKEFGKTELRILILSAISLGRDNVIVMSQREMADKLGVTPQAVNRSVSVLIERGLIFQKGHRLRLNSRLATREPVKELIRLRSEEVRELGLMLEE